MGRSSTKKAIGLFALFGVGQAAYTLKDTYTSQNFFQQFEFFSQADYTHGYVKYVDGQTANQVQLAGFAREEIFLGVDNKGATESGPGGMGRKSVRVHSKKEYTGGLFISDITHMPVGCGVWPALWTVRQGSGSDEWPRWGEIDIIEGVHTSTQNAVALHTGPGCAMTNAGSINEGKLGMKNGNNDCSKPGGKGFEGCSQETINDPGNYGDGFNKQKGGIYAMEWTDARIAVWFFPRGSPTEQAISQGGAAPNPASWGKPMANFASSSQCAIANHFKQHKIIINTTLCGDWAGAENVWKDPKFGCAAKAPTCSEFVTKNPGAFTNAYWTIKSIKVYQQ